MKNTVKHNCNWVVMMSGILRTFFLVLLIGSSASAFAWTVSNGAKIYFDNTNTAWYVVDGSNSIQCFVGHNAWIAGDNCTGYSDGKLMTHIANTNLYYYNFTSNWPDFGDFRFGFTNGTSGWGNVKCKTNYNQLNDNSIVQDGHRCYTNHYGIDYTATYWMCVPTGSAAAVDMNAPASAASYTSWNYTQTVARYLATAAGFTSYSASTDASYATINFSSYSLTSPTAAAATGTKTIAAGSSSNTCTAARSAVVTITVSGVAYGYRFRGFYNTSGTELKSAASADNGDGSYTYTYNATAATEVRVRFDKCYTVSFHTNFIGDTPATQYVPWGGKISTPTSPSATGWTFGGWYTTPDCSGLEWVVGSTTVSRDTVLYAKWTADTYYYRSIVNSWNAVAMTNSDDGMYAYCGPITNNANQFKIAKTTTGWDYNYSYVSKNFNGTNVGDIGDYSKDDAYIWASGSYYIIVYYPNTKINTTGNPKICASTSLPNNFNLVGGLKLYFDNTTANWSSLYFRVGRDKSSSSPYYKVHNSNVQFTSNLVPGTAGLYMVTTPSYENYTKYHFSDNCAYSGDDNSIANFRPGGYNITNCIPLREELLANNYTFVPGATTSRDGYTEYAVTRYTGLLMHTATIGSHTNGTIAFSYTDQNGGSHSGVTSNVTVPHTCNLTITATPNTGYNFSTLTVGSDAHTNGTAYVLKADKTVAATFTAKTYTVTLHDNINGDHNGSATATYNNGLTSVSRPTRTGYTVEGYYTAPVSGSKVAGPAGGLQPAVAPYTNGSSKWIYDDNATLYAYWNANNYNITLNYNYDDCPSAVVISATYDAACPEFDALTRTGYDLDGYWTGKKAGTKVINADGTFVASAGTMTDASAHWVQTGAQTLYAHWTPSTYDITLDANGGASAGSAVATYLSDDLGSYLAVGSKTGYTLDGYYTGESDGDMVIDDSGNLVADVTGYTDEDGNWIRTSDATLYAHWNINSYTITWSVLGNTDLTTNQNYNTTLIEQAAPAFSCSERQFIGWSASPVTPIQDAAPSLVNFSTTKVTADATYYAVFASRNGKVLFENLSYPTAAASPTYTSVTRDFTSRNGVKWQVYNGNLSGTGKATYYTRSNYGGASTQGVLMKTITALGAAPYLMTTETIPNLTKVTFYAGRNNSNVSAVVEYYDGSSWTGTQDISFTNNTASYLQTLTLPSATNAKIRVRITDVTASAYDLYLSDFRFYTSDETYSSSDYSTTCAYASSATVTFAGDGVSKASDTKTYLPYYYTTPTADEVTRDGYVLVGWRPSNGSADVVPGGTYLLNHSVTLTAVWEADTHDVTIHRFGGDDVSEVDDGDDFDLPDQSDPVGYTFVGYATAACAEAAASPVTYEAGDKVTNVTADVELWAIYSFSKLTARKGDFELVSSTAAISDGDTVAFASSMSDGSAYVMGAKEVSESRRTATAVTISGGKIPYNAAYAYTLKSGYVDGKWAFYVRSASKYLYASSTGNNLLGERVTKDEKTDFTIAFNLDGSADVAATWTDFGKIQFYSTASNTYFSAYKNAQKPVYMYKRGKGAATMYTSSPETLYSITVNSASHGSVTADYEAAETGTVVTLSIRPDVGYELSSIEVTGATYNSSTKQFTVASSNVTVTPTFALGSYTIRYIADDGTAAKTSDTEQAYNAVVTLPAVTATAYGHFLGWTDVDYRGAAAPDNIYAAGAEWTVTGDKTFYAVYAVYEKKQTTAELNVGDYVVIAAAGYNKVLTSKRAGGGNNRSAAAATKAGELITFSYAAADSVAELLVGDGSATVASTFTFFDAKAADRNGAGGYLCVTSDGGNLHAQASLTAAGCWTVTIEDGIATLFSNTTNTSPYMQYYYTVSTEYYSCYAAATAKRALSIYGRVYTTRPVPMVIDEDSDLPDCSECSIIVTDGATVTAVDGYTLNSLTLEAGTHLVVPAGVSFSTDYLVLQRENDVTASANIQGSLTVTEGTFFDMTFGDDRWYWMSLPKTVAIADVLVDGMNDKFRESDGYGWYMKYYNGATRAANGSGGWVTNKDASSYPSFEANRGYALGLASGTHTLRFPLGTDWSAQASAQTTAIYKNTGSKGAVHDGWNLVGSPYIDRYKSSSWAGVAEGYLDWVDGDPGYYRFVPESNARYITVPLNGGYTGYAQHLVADYTLQPFTAYFFQVDLDEDGVLNFTTAGKQSSLPARYAPQGEEPQLVSVRLMNSNGEMDETTIVIADNYDAALYERNADLIKMMGDKYTQYSKPALWSVSDAGSMAFNAMNETDTKSLIPLGYYASESGTYTFTLNAERNMDNVAEVLLYDASLNTVTDLLSSDYVFTSGRQTSDTGRFSINIRYRDNMPTDVENVAADGKGIRKMIIGETMYIIMNNGTVYNATGGMVNKLTERRTK